MSESYLNQRTAKDWKKSHKHGAGEWLAERFTSLILTPLTIWAVWSGFQLSGGGYEAALAFVKAPLNAGLILAIFVISGWHMYMGLKVITDDYIGKAGTRTFLTLLNLLFCLGVTGAVAYALYLLVRF